MAFSPSRSAMWRQSLAGSGGGRGSRAGGGGSFGRGGDRGSRAGGPSQVAAAPLAETAAVGAEQGRGDARRGGRAPAVAAETSSFPQSWASYDGGLERGPGKLDPPQQPQQQQWPAKRSRVEPPPPTVQADALRESRPADSIDWSIRSCIFAGTRKEVQKAALAVLDAAARRKITYGPPRGQLLAIYTHGQEDKLCDRVVANCWFHQQLTTRSEHSDAAPLGRGEEAEEAGPLMSEESAEKEEEDEEEAKEEEAVSEISSDEIGEWLAKDTLTSVKHAMVSQAAWQPTRRQQQRRRQKRRQQWRRRTSSSSVSAAAAKAAD